MYHIVNSKSKVKPVQVVNVDPNSGEVINTSQLLKSKSACITNIVASIDEVFCECSCYMYVMVQDDTLKRPTAYKMFDTKKRVYGISPSPKYIAGRNPKKKK